MTDTELNVLELCARGAMTDSWYMKTTSMDDATAAYTAAANPAVILKLIAELRQTKAERDWLAKLAANNIPTINDFVRATQGWLDAAKEAVCTRKD